MRTRYHTRHSNQAQVVHGGFLLWLRNPLIVQTNEKRKIPKFVIAGPPFSSRWEIHKYLKTHYPKITSKDYRITGIRYKLH